MMAEEFLNGIGSTPNRETEWMPFATLELKGKRLMMVETRVLPAEDDGIIIAASPGQYSVEIRGVAPDGERRVSRIRVLPSGTDCELGNQIGSINVDMGGIAICDADLMCKFATQDEDEYMEWLEELLFESDADYGVVECEAAGTAVPYLPTGYGDGSYPVFELLCNGIAVGLEAAYLQA